MGKNLTFCLNLPRVRRSNGWYLQQQGPGLKDKNHLIRGRVGKLGRGSQCGQDRGRDGAGGGVEAHGDTPAGLAEREGEGGGLTELTDLKQTASIPHSEDV